MREMHPPDNEKDNIVRRRPLPWAVSAVTLSPRLCSQRDCTIVWTRRRGAETAHPAECARNHSLTCKVTPGRPRYRQQGSQAEQRTIPGRASGCRTVRWQRTWRLSVLTVLGAAIASGLGDAEDRLSPTNVAALAGKGISAIACGAEYTLAISAVQQRVYRWGWCAPPPRATPPEHQPSSVNPRCSCAAVQCGRYEAAALEVRVWRQCVPAWGRCTEAASAGRVHRTRLLQETPR